MKLAICNEMFEGWSLVDVFAVAAELGFDAVEVAPFTLAESVRDISSVQRESIRRDAERVGVEIAGLHWLFVSPKGLSLNGPDPTLRAKTREYLMELVRFCADLGGRIMVFGSPQQRNVVEGVSYEEAFAYARETFRACAELAGEWNIVLCLEPLTSRSTNFITTPEEAFSLVQAVDHPNFQMMLDVYSSSAEGVDIPAAIRRFAPWIRHVHANDSNGYLPGSGEANYDALVAALREVGYEGYLSVEVFDFKPDPRTIAVRSVEFLRRYVPKER